MGRTTTWDLEATWTEAELAWFGMGPFDGEIPGLVRRVRRVLDVSQRGLAALLEVSQSVVARWETGRTSPRASMVHDLLRLAGLHATFHDDETGEEVEPMRDDGCRDRRARRHPAHVDLTAIGWWHPRGAESTAGIWRWRNTSRERREPLVRFRTDPERRRIERLLFGTPDDHPSVTQLAAEAEHLDERLDERREQRREKRRQEQRERARAGAMRRPGPGPEPTTSLTA